MSEDKKEPGWAVNLRKARAEVIRLRLALKEPIVYDADPIFSITWAEVGKYAVSFSTKQTLTVVDATPVTYVGPPYIKLEDLTSEK